jgi:hypothetical protein
MLNFNFVEQSTKQGWYSFSIEVSGSFLSWAVTFLVIAVGIMVPLTAYLVGRAKRNAAGLGAMITDATYYKRELAEVRDREKAMIAELTALFSGQKRVAVFREKKDAPEEETERQSQQLP